MSVPTSVADLIESYFLYVRPFRCGRGGAYRWNCSQGVGPIGAGCPYRVHGSHGDTLAEAVLNFLRGARDRYDAAAQAAEPWPKEGDLAWRNKVAADLEHF